MAYVSIDETVGSRRAMLQVSNGAFKTTYTRVFQVITDDTLTDLNDIINSQLGSLGVGPDQLPEIGDPYPSDSSAVVTKIEPQEEDGHLKFLVLVTYTNPDAQGVASDPTTLDWQFSTAVEEYQEIVEVDAIDGDPVVNSAGDPFNPPIEEVQYRHVIHLKKWFNTWDLADEYARQGKVNNADFTLLGYLFPKRCLRCTQWTTSGKQNVSGGEYYQLNATFVFKPQFDVETIAGATTLGGWQRAIIDRGFRELRAGQRLQILEGNVKITTPRLLNGAGGARPDNTYDPIFLPFNSVDEADFSTFGLPAAIP